MKISDWIEKAEISSTMENDDSMCFAFGGPHSALSLEFYIYWKPFFAKP